jgi:sodium transport system permease protein
VIPTTAGRAVGVLVLAAFAMQAMGPVVAALGLPGYVIAQVVAFAMPAVLMAVARGGARGDLGLVLPGWRALLAAAFVGLGLWAFLLGTVLRLQEWLFPLPRELAESLESLAPDHLPVWIPLVCVAFAPAVCEELLCRGLLLRGLARRFGPGVAIVGAAVGFALLHISPYRFAPTFLLGLTLGTLAWLSRSVVPAVIVHLFNNASVILLGEHVSAESFVVPLVGGTTVLTGIALAWWDWRLSPDIPSDAPR